MQSKYTANVGRNTAMLNRNSYESVPSNMGGNHSQNVPNMQMSMNHHDGNHLKPSPKNRQRKAGHNHQSNQRQAKLSKFSQSQISTGFMRS
mmetsp:Transcript_7908/g.13264  ORF Transcript_7908/g.13264 Transcript_7908/m.13264 type:complete len:91 (-) Transcript_7908:175-447(-)